MKWLSRKLLVAVGALTGGTIGTAVSDSFTAGDFLPIVMWVVIAYLAAQAGPDAIKELLPMLIEKAKRKG